MKKFLFSLKQLIPVTYWSTYRANDKKYFTVWRQWFCKPFNVVTFEIT